MHRILGLKRTEILLRHEVIRGQLPTHNGRVLCGHEHHRMVSWEGMTESTTYAYMAGFFDGDGTIVATVEPSAECRFGYRTRVVLKCAQHEDHRDICEYFAQVLGCGSIVRSQRNVVEFTVKSTENVKRVLTILLPYLRIKRRQAALALELLELAGEKDQARFRRAVRLVREIQSLNYSGRSRRTEHTPVTTDPVRERLRMPLA